MHNIGFKINFNEMTWNYRVMKKKNELGEYDFAIYEVYYNENGKVNGWTENPLTPICSSEDDLLHEMTVMMEAFTKETLEHQTDLTNERTT